jgi:predicted membrane protein DUF2231
MDLPKHPVVHGHPIHAALSDGPIVLIPVAIAAELLDRRHVALGLRPGDLAAAMAAATSIAAATIGWVDWLTIPRNHPAWRPATIHGIVNTAAVLAVAAAVPVRRRRLRLLGAATATVVVGAWIGGDLVFRHGWRVRPAEEAELVEERLRDPAVVDAFAIARRDVAEFERAKTFLPPG